MSLETDITALKASLSEFRTLNELKRYLIAHHIELMTTIYSDGFSCLDCDITSGLSRGSINLTLAIKLTSTEESSSIFENRTLQSIHLDHHAWNEETLLTKITETIATLG